MTTANQKSKFMQLPWLSLIFSALIILIALSFRNFFFITPNKSNSLLAVIQVFYFVGWVLLVVLPPALLFMIRNLNTFVRVMLMVTVLIFPAAAIADHVVLAIIAGDPYLGYLASYPILLVANTIIPAMYVILLVRLKPVEPEPEPEADKTLPLWRMPNQEG